ncbi:MAG TPA: DUF1614 domain-containing protein [Candidatus Methanoperedens sp.]
MTFRKLGFPPEYSVYFLFLSLLGSYVNIPIKKVKLQHAPIISDRKNNFHLSDEAALPIENKRNTFIEVNIGGAVIPAVMSGILYTMVGPIKVLIGIFIMTFIIHKIAKPVKGSGIVIHALLPPILAAAVAFIISPQDAPIIAYISGTLGCLIGIDLLNLKKIPDLEMKVISIGGAGTFDAIFLTGIISVLLA